MSFLSNMKARFMGWFQKKEVQVPTYTPAPVTQTAILPMPVTPPQIVWPTAAVPQVPSPSITTTTKPEDHTNDYWFANGTEPGGGHWAPKADLWRPPSATLQPVGSVKTWLTGDGLLAVIMQVGTPEQREKAGARLWINTGATVADHSAASRVINDNANADGTFNAVVLQLVNGKSVEDAFKVAAKGYDGNYNDPGFTLDDVRAAQSALASL